MTIGGVGFASLLVQLSHVLLQVKVPTEAFAAGGALKGLLVVVGVLQ